MGGRSGFFSFKKKGGVLGEAFIREYMVNKYIHHTLAYFDSIAVLYSYLYYTKKIYSFRNQKARFTN